jgi:hypothetical protein
MGPPFNHDEGEDDGRQEDSDRGLPRDLFDELCDEAEFHAANRKPDRLGPHRALVAEHARRVVEAGAYIEATEGRNGRFHKRVVRFAGRKGPRRPLDWCVPLEFA